MLVYNILSNLTAPQFLVFAAFEVLFLTLSWLVFKVKTTVKILFISALMASVLALLSSLIGSGRYGGMLYQERLGWPFPFLFVSRNIEAGSLVGVPTSSRFDLLKFLATSAFWGVFPLSLMLSLTPNQRFRLFTGIFMAVFVIFTMIFSLNNARNTPGRTYSEILEAYIPDSMIPDPNTVKIMREKIEETYPEFADFENQPSFAGQSVKVLLEGGEYYFAYLTHGSGVPIVKATCFRVDWQTAYKIGEYPNPNDSYRGHSDINPQTCKGIR